MPAGFDLPMIDITFFRKKIPWFEYSKRVVDIVYLFTVKHCFGKQYMVKCTFMSVKPVTPALPIGKFLP